MDLSQVEALSNVINTSIAQLKELNASGASAATNPAFLKPSNQIIAAAAQLVAYVRTPERYLMDMSTAFQLSSCLRTAIETNVSEILRERGQGPKKALHIKEISAINHVNYSKLSRVLRLLVTHHVFEEVSPNTFANNSISAALDTNKSIAELEARPAEKYDGSNGIAALCGIFSDETFHNSVVLADTLKDPKTTDSFHPLAAPFSRAWPNVEKVTMYEWMSLPQNNPRLKRFGMGMNGMNGITPSDAILRGFNWSRLPKGATVVDCGGGVGSVSLPIVQTVPHVNLVVQDTEKVVAEAPAFWQTQFPQALNAGRISFQAQNFFDPQPSINNNAAVWLLRMIVHNWPDAESIQILKRVRECVGSNKSARLVLVDNIMLYASRQQTVDGEASGPIDAETLAPKPLLANWGVAQALSYKQDINMLTNHNAQERTIPEFQYLLSESGWRITEVHQAHQSWLPQIVAEPI